MGTRRVRFVLRFFRASITPDPVTQPPDVADVAVLDYLGERAWAETCFRHRHVVDVLTGSPPVDNTTKFSPNVDYDLRNRLVDRIEEKLEELARDGIALSWRTFRR